MRMKLGESCYAKPVLSQLESTMPGSDALAPMGREHVAAVSTQHAGRATEDACKPMGRQHVAAVTALHRQALGGLLTMLGPRAIAACYRGYLASPGCTAFVAELDGVVRGFVLGSDAPEAMRRDALRANLFEIARGVAYGVLRRPATLRHVFAGVVARASGFDSSAPELTYVAVRDVARGAGVGSALVRAFEESLRRRGVTRYELSVEAGNHAARGFYEAHGMRKESSYVEFDRTYHRYEYDVTLETGTKA
jgi:ribosomal protein S18 acetylase RimI-like enzyme